MKKMLIGNEILVSILTFGLFYFFFDLLKTKAGVDFKDITVMNEVVFSSAFWVIICLIVIGVIGAIISSICYGSRFELFTDYFFCCSFIAGLAVIMIAVVIISSAPAAKVLQGVLQHLFLSIAAIVMGLGFIFTYTKRSKEITGWWDLLSLLGQWIVVLIGLMMMVRYI